MTDDEASVIAYIAAHGHDTGGGRGGRMVPYDDVRRDVFAGDYGRSVAAVRALRLAGAIEHRVNGHLCLPARHLPRSRSDRP